MIQLVELSSLDVLRRCFFSSLYSRRILKNALAIARSALAGALAQDSRTLFFTDLRIHTDDDAGNEGNFGLGLRRMYASSWNLCAYAYYDRKRTEFGNYFNQATLGLEALGRDFEFRANGYLPFGEPVVHWY